MLVKLLDRQPLTKGTASRSRHAVEIGIVVAGTVFSLAAAGCATKGFVRRELTGIRSEMAAGQDALRSEMVEMRNSVDQALARAEIANGLAGEARDLALGKVGYREVERYTVSFGYNQDEIEPGAQITLDEIASRMQAHAEYLVDVYGFTDANGSPRYNYELGRRRAESVVRGLSERVPGSLHRYAAVSYGESQPMTQTPPVARRRVEISLIERTTSTEKGDSISQSAN